MSGRQTCVFSQNVLIPHRALLTFLWHPGTLNPPSRLLHPAESWAHFSQPYHLPFPPLMKPSTPGQILSSFCPLGTSPPSVHPLFSPCSPATSCSQVLGDLVPLLVLIQPTDLVHSSSGFTAHSAHKLLWARPYGL